MAVATRTFDAGAQLTFAELSGDRNPMHMDALAARRTQAGAPVVHGLHLVLWALDELADQGVIEAPFRVLKVQFHRFVHVGAVAELRIVRLSDKGIVAAVDSRGVTATTITIGGDYSGPAIDGALSDQDVRMDRCAVLDMPEWAGRQGRLPALDDAPVGVAFPALTKLIGSSPVRDLAQLSALVGMVCPGLHSIFAGLNVQVRGGDSADRVSFRVQEVDDRFRMADVAVAGGGLSGIVTAFMRYPPIEQPSISQLAGLVAPDEFASVRALVIGGSRGLGSITSRLLALGGAQLVATYASGEAEAGILAAEINAFAGSERCAILRYDALEPAGPQLAGLPWAPDQLYYFATSRIFRQKGVLYAPSDFADFAKVYVDGFQAACAALQARSPTLTAFYPSSVAVEDHPQDMIEYSMAKAAGEMLCADLNRFQKGLRVVVSRLPRILTDQTATVALVESHDPVEVMLPLVREMCAAG